MVLVQNTDVIQNVRTAARLSISEGFPQALQMSFVPVIDVTPDFHRKPFCKPQADTTTGSLIILTAAAGKETYLTGWNLSFIKNATCDSATGHYQLTATIEGVSTILASMAILTLTAQTGAVQMTLKDPIKIDAGTQVTLSGTFTAGALSRSAQVYGFEVIN